MPVQQLDTRREHVSSKRVMLTNIRGTTAQNTTDKSSVQQNSTSSPSDRMIDPRNARRVLPSSPEYSMTAPWRRLRAGTTLKLEEVPMRVTTAMLTIFGSQPSSWDGSGEYCMGSTIWENYK